MASKIRSAICGGLAMLASAGYAASTNDAPAVATDGLYENLSLPIQLSVAPTPAKLTAIDFLPQGYTNRVQLAGTIQNGDFGAYKIQSSRSLESPEWIDSSVGNTNIVSRFGGKKNFFVGEPFIYDKMFYRLVPVSEAN